MDGQRWSRGEVEMGQGCTSVETRHRDTRLGQLLLSIGLTAEPRQVLHACLAQVGPEPKALRVQNPQPDRGHVLLLHW